MVAVVCFLAHNHNVMSYDNHILYLSKTLVQLALKTSPATVMPNGITVYLNLPSSVLKVVRNEEASSSCWCQYPILQSQTIIMHVSASKWAMSSRVLKWYSSLTIALFTFVGSKHILSYKLPDLSLPSTRTKLLIHGVASCKDFSTPACNILLSSC